MHFVHLQVQSAYSLLNSTAKIEDLVKKAKELGFTSLALTDENVMYGAIPFYKECLKQNIKPIIGLTVSVLANDDSDENKSYSLILLAKNKQGYKNLLKISSIVNTKSKAGIPKKWLASYSKGLIAITPGVKGEIEQNILKNKLEKAKDLTLFYKQLFEPGCFYCALQNHNVKEQDIVNQRLITLKEETGVKLVATNQVHYLEKNDAHVHECLLAIKHGMKLSDETRMKLPTKEYCLKSAAEMAELFSSIPDVVKNTLTIADQCNVMIELGKAALPKFPVPNGQSAVDYLKDVCMDGLKKRCKVEENAYVERLTYELDVISKMNFSDYFLIVWDFMRFAHQRGITTGPGRGSAAGSLVAYALQITEIDPIKYNLLFERFLNPERVSMPDIDIDFPDTRRDEIIQYVATKYGQVHVAQIITFGTFGARAALRDVGRVMGISVKEADTLAKKVPSQLGITLIEAYKESKLFNEYIEQSEIAKKIFTTAMKIEGLPRHTSTHAAGVVISEQPLTDLIAIQEGHQNIYLTQYSMDILEEIGLLKMDFLGLRNLTLIENIRTLVYKETGKEVNLSTIPFNDQKTFTLLSKGDTTGIFQLESAGMRNVLQRLKPSELEDIVAVNALYRPGPMENIPLYIDRKHNKRSITFPHPDLEPILKNTHGVIVYQEQIMQIASKMAGFSLGEADLLRRAVSKKKKEILDEERSHFVEGCVKKGYREDIASVIYDLIVRFANYGFNRSHAVAYSVIAYQLAYLKTNYPLYFTQALLTSVIGNDEKIAQYVREAKQCGLVVRPPSVNKSSFTFKVEQGEIRFSLAAIKYVGAAALKEILLARKQKPFRDLFDFCLRISQKHVNRRTLEGLIFSGSFDEFGEDRATLLASLDVALEHAELVRPSGSSQIDLFLDEDITLKPKYVEVEHMKVEEKLRFEKDALGFYLSSHPTTSFKRSFQYESLIPISELTYLKDKKAVKVGIYITNVRTIRTKQGEVMAFLSLSDESGDIDAVAFPKVYKKYSNSLQVGTLLLIEGFVDLREDRLQLVVQNVKTIQDLEQFYKDEKKVLYLKIEADPQLDRKLYEVKHVLKQYYGQVPVLVYYEANKRTIRLTRENWVTPTNQCINELKKILGAQNVVLKGD